MGLGLVESLNRPGGNLTGSSRSKPRFAIHRFNDLEISAREQISQDLPIIVLILDH